MSRSYGQVIFSALAAADIHANRSIDSSGLKADLRRRSVP
jgi:hypothetical protein